MDRITRRRLLALSAALLAAPLGVDAQPAARVHPVGWLAAFPAPPELLDAFRNGLREFGWVEGRNLLIMYRHAEGHLDRLPEVAAELVRMKVDVILAAGSPALEAARNATRTVPIVMVFGSDPVESGLVASLARPGGNITGLISLSADLSLKQLEFLKEMLPGLSRVAILWNPANPSHPSAVKRLEVAARALGVQLQIVGVREPGEFDAGFAAMVRERARSPGPGLHRGPGFASRAERGSGLPALPVASWRSSAPP